jgi:hypothetical protein
MDTKSLIPHGIAIVLFICVSALYFLPQFQGKVLVQGDIISYKGMANEILEYNNENEDVALWTNSMFSGMPAYQINAPQKTNVSTQVQKVMTLGIPRPAGLFLLGSICAYILLILLGVNPWISVFVALGTSFATNNLILLEAGHMTKVTSLMSIPLVIAGTMVAYRKHALLGAAVFTLGMMLNLKANHYQMTYYLGLCMLIYVGIELFHHIKSGSLPTFLKSSGLLILGLVLAFGTGASKLMTTYEYSKDTMRGDPILTQQVDPTSSSSVDGLAWDYAMQWSNSGIDLLSSFIPKVVGGSSGEKVSPKSDLGKKLGLRKAESLGVYWGGLPFTSGPIYFGAILCFLFLFGSIVYKGPYRSWIVLAVMFTMYISLGKNFEFFNRILFDYFPMFNKFRTPNSVLSVTAFILPILGALGLNKLVKDEIKESYLTPLLISAGVLLGICLLVIIIGPSVFGFSSPGDVRYEQAGFPIDLLIDHRISVMRSSALTTFVFILIAAAAMFFHIKGKLNKYITIGIVGLFAVIDIMSVNLGYVNSEAFISERKLNREFFTPRPVDQQILQDGDPHYRVLDLTVNTFSSSRSSYFHKTIGGYHAAKLQRYQDIIDYQISKNNQDVLNMLNTKYIIGSGTGDQPVAQINPSNLGNAWFVNEVIYVDSPDDEMARLNNFDPLGQAIVHSEFRDYIGDTNLDKNGSIRLTSYTPNELKYQSTSSSDQLAIFSEVWYGPDKGWKIYIDGNEVPLLRANYILRAAMIPSGNHEIVMKFDPVTYAKGNTMSLIASILSLIFIGLCLFGYWKWNKNDNTKGMSIAEESTS